MVIQPAAKAAIYHGQFIWDGGWTHKSPIHLPSNKSATIAKSAAMPFTPSASALTPKREIEICTLGVLCTIDTPLLMLISNFRYALHSRVSVATFLVRRLENAFDIGGIKTKDRASWEPNFCPEKAVTIQSA